MNITSRKEAMAKGLKTYFTGKPCPKGHIAERYVCSWNCVECRKEYYQNNHELRLEYMKKYQQNNPGYNKEYYQNNRERRREYNQRNKAKLNALAMKRHKHVKRATPSWVDLEEIEMFYFEAWRKSQGTGIEHHVDHIVPLRGDRVSGLHVPWNLQVIPATENRRKSNRLVEELL